MTSDSYLEKMKTAFDKSDMGDAEKALNEIVSMALKSSDGSILYNGYLQQLDAVISTALKNAGKVDMLVKALDRIASDECMPRACNWVKVIAEKALAEFRKENP